MLHKRRWRLSVVSAIAALIAAGPARAKPRRPARVGVIADGLGLPHSLVADREQLYWIERWGKDRIVRMPKRGGPPVEILSDENIVDLAVDAGWIYYYRYLHAPGTGQAQVRDEQIRRVPVGGGSVRTLADAPEFEGRIVVSDGQICWVKAQGRGAWALVCASISGGSAPVTRMLPVSKSPPEFIMAGRRIYFSNDDGVFLSEDGEDARLISRGGSLYAFDFQRDDTHVYWFQHEAIWRVQLAGGTPERIVVRKAVFFGLHGDAVYWLDGYRLFRAPKRGGAPERRARFKPRIPYLHGANELIVDETGAYWLSDGITTPNAPGELCPKSTDPGTGILVRLRL